MARFSSISFSEAIDEPRMWNTHLSLFDRFEKADIP